MENGVVMSLIALAGSVAAIIGGLVDKYFSTKPELDSLKKDLAINDARTKDLEIKHKDCEEDRIKSTEKFMTPWPSDPMVLANVMHSLRHAGLPATMADAIRVVRYHQEKAEKSLEAKAVVAAQEVTDLANAKAASLKADATKAAGDLHDAIERGIDEASK